MEINDQQFEDAIATGTSLVVFTAPGCVHCNIMAPAVGHVIKQHPDLKVFRANRPDAPEAIKRYGVPAFPMFVMFQDGKEIHRLLGSQQFAVFEKFVSKGLAHGDLVCS